MRIVWSFNDIFLLPMTNTTSATNNQGDDTVIVRLADLHRYLIAAYTAGALKPEGGSGIDACAYAEAEKIMRAWDLPDAPAVEQGEKPAKPLIPMPERNKAEWDAYAASCQAPEKDAKAGSIVDTPEFKKLLMATEVASPDRDDGDHMRKRYETCRAALVCHLEKVVQDVASTRVIDPAELIPVAKVGYIPGHYEDGLEADIIDRSLVRDGMTLYALASEQAAAEGARND
jgi:hypothetical protein